MRQFILFDSVGTIPSDWLYSQELLVRPLSLSDFLVNLPFQSLLKPCFQSDRSFCAYGQSGGFYEICIHTNRHLEN